VVAWVGMRPASWIIAALPIACGSRSALELPRDAPSGGAAGIDAGAGGSGGSGTGGIPASGGSGGCASGTPCGAECVDTRTDPRHCGGCNLACGFEARCIEGSCFCFDGRPFCDGRCIAPETDPRHCGGCDHDCLGGECRDGRCQPVLLAEIGDDPAQIAIDEAHVYWTANNFGGTEPGFIRRVAKAGGEIETLVKGQISPLEIAADSSGIYWTNGGGSVQRAAHDGSGTSRLASGSTPWGIAIDEAHVYWTDYYGGTVRRVPKSAGTAMTIASGQEQPRCLAVDRGLVYWINRQSDADVLLRAPAAGGEAPLTLGTGPAASGACRVAVAGDDVYWLGPPPHLLRRTPVGGGTPTVLVSEPGTWAGGMALHGTVAFWTAASAVYATSRIGETTLLAEVPTWGQAGDIEVDDTAVYWLTSWSDGRGAIVKLAR
jgi:hypothetical protein